MFGIFILKNIYDDNWKNNLEPGSYDAYTPIKRVYLFEKVKASIKQ